MLVGVGLGLGGYAKSLSESFCKTITRTGGVVKKKINLTAGLRQCKTMFVRAHKAGKKVIFIGNGGSAAIASHLAIDYTKNGGIRAVAFNDLAALTCMANDFGYPQVFAKQLEYFAQKGDVVVCISSSGMSRNILEAAAIARTLNLDIITLSGMDSDNRLSGCGSVNFYVPANDYGLIEITHLSILHAITSVPNL